LAPTVEDGALILQAIAGIDNKDSSSADEAVPSWHDHLPDLSPGAASSLPLSGVRIGLPRVYGVKELSPEANTAWTEAAERASSMGADIVEVDLPHTRHALAAYYTIATAEAASNLSRYDGVHYGYTHRDLEAEADIYTATRSRCFGVEVQRRIMVGSFVLSSESYSVYFEQAMRVRRIIRDELAHVLRGGKEGEGVDCLLTPTSLGGAPLLSDTSGQDPVELYLNDVMTVPASLAGLPAVSIPIGLNNQGLPLGLQVVAAAFDEAAAFRVGHCLQQDIGTPN